MTETKCPDEMVLFDYAVGRLSDEDSDEVALHLEACSLCQAELATLDDANDTLVGRLRTPVPDEPYLAESHCGLALARAKAVVGRPQPPPGSLRAGLGPPTPQTLGEYRLLEKVGQGGMGSVYKALHTKLDRLVALKILPKGRVGDRQAIARFEREMRAVGRLEHPNIVQAHDAREIEDTPVLIMQYVEGMDLAELVRRLRRLRTCDACELARQAALALQYAHEHGLVHRDVKPSNLMLTRHGELKLLDLGLARFYLESPAGADATDSGQAMGTADYMAPEQVSNSREADIRADIYALGCTLYKLLSGRAPFSGPQYLGNFEKMTAHVGKAVPPIRELVPEVPEGLAGLLDRMLAKDPDGRPATPAEVAELLEPFSKGHELVGLITEAEKQEPPSEVSAAVESPLQGRPGAEPSPHAQRRRGMPIPVVVALTLLSFLGGLALGIVIRIEWNGKTTELAVPDESRVDISEEGRVSVKVPGAAEAAERPRAAAVAEIAALRGWWEVVSVERGEAADLFTEAPASTPRFDLADIDRVLIKDDLRLYDLDRGVFFNVSYAVNPAPSPGTIDLLTRSTTSSKPGETIALGLYALEGDTLRICVARYLPSLVADQRPEDFHVERRSGDLLVTLRRYEFTADEKAIQKGTWRLVSAAVDGRPVPAEELVGTASPYGAELERESRPAEFWFIGYHFHENAKFLQESFGTGLYVLDPSRHPKAITLNYFPSNFGGPPKPGHGIYELSGDRLRIAWREGGPRPEELESEPGSGVTLIELERTEPETTEAPTSAQAAPSPRPGLHPAAADAVAERPDAARSLQAFQGLWEVVSVEQGEAADFGRAGPNYTAPFGRPFDPAQIDRLSIKDTVDLYDFDQGRVFRFDYLLNPVSSPGTVDLLSYPPYVNTREKECPGLGIYELEGESLKICLTRPLPKLAGGQRPEDFQVEPDSADVLFTLRRYELRPDEKALDGHWRFASLVVDGSEVAAEGQESFITFSNPWHYFLPESLVGRSGRQGLYILDEHCEPKAAITLSPWEWTLPSVEAEPLHGIYELSGGRLRIAWREGGPRPKELKSEPGSGVTLIELEREQAEAPDATRASDLLAPPAVKPKLGPGTKPEAKAEVSAPAQSGPLPRGLSVRLYAPAGSRAVGETAEFAFTVSNTGGPVQNLEVAARFDPQLVPQHASPDFRRQDGALLWTLDTLPAGASRKFGIICKCTAEAARACVRIILTAEDGANDGASVFVRIVAAPEGLEATPSAAHQAILGTWDVVKNVRFAERREGGKKSVERVENDVDQIELTEEWIVFHQRRGVRGKCRYTLNPNTDPKQFDLINQGQLYALGICELEGDRLMIFYSTSLKRPKAIPAETQVDTDEELLVLKRADPDKTEAADLPAPPRPTGAAAQAKTPAPPKPIRGPIHPVEED